MSYTAASGRGIEKTQIKRISLPMVWNDFLQSKGNHGFTIESPYIRLSSFSFAEEGGIISKKNAL